VFLDLPVLTGEEDPVAPYVAVSAEPWQPAAVYSSADGAGFSLDAVVERAAVLGETQSELAAAPAGTWYRGPPLRLRLSGGAVSSATDMAVLNGANAMAIGSGEGDWEVFQFARAELVEPGVWQVSRLLRGQAGTDTLVPPVWPSGSRVVLLDGGPVQFPLPASMIGVERAYRYGPARRSPDDPAYREVARTFRAAGLRPYAPVRLKAVVRGADIDFSWLRRTRIDGDRWDALDVPLGEASERYLVRVVAGGNVRRQIEVSVPFWTYSGTMRNADGVLGAFGVEIAQISDRVGPGLMARIVINE
jgi:choline dehydrogenase-like flavoprotein